MELEITEMYLRIKNMSIRGGKTASNQLTEKKTIKKINLVKRLEAEAERMKEVNEIQHEAEVNVKELYAGKRAFRWEKENAETMIEVEKLRGVIRDLVKEKEEMRNNFRAKMDKIKENYTDVAMKDVFEYDLVMAGLFGNNSVV